MRTFATVFSIAMTCAALSAFAQDTEDKAANNSEVTIESGADSPVDSE